MAFDLRYNLRHVGDIFIGAVQKTADTAVQCSRGVFLTYDIQLLQCKKMKASREVGDRISMLIKEGVSDVTTDTVLSELIAKLNCIEKDLAAHECARKNLFTIFKPKENGV
jgi:hypothetical protein